MFLHVDEANYISDYQLRLKFNNNEVRTVDLKDELFGEFLNLLKTKIFLKIFSYLTIL